MVTETTLAKKQVSYGSQSYTLCYRLIDHEEKGYGIEIICRSFGKRERECVFLKARKGEVERILRLFAKETVFPIALRETLDNYL